MVQLQPRGTEGQALIEGAARLPLAVQWAAYSCFIDVMIAVKHLELLKALWYNLA